MTCEHVTSVLIPYCEIPVSINSIDVMGITRLAESSTKIITIKLPLLNYLSNYRLDMSIRMLDFDHFKSRIKTELYLRYFEA